jgi:putative ABC transport system ATP-binding protein
LLSSNSRPFASCCESYAILDEVSGRTLSGGEQQRVAIARAIVGSPSAVLADEPTAALDSVNGRIVMKVLAEIAKNPARRVLVVAHDPRIIPFANRIIHIEDGRIVSVEPGAAGSNLR